MTENKQTEIVNKEDIETDENLQKHIKSYSERQYKEKGGEE